MRVVFLEPLGISEEKLFQIFNDEFLSKCHNPRNVEVIFHKDRREDVDTLIERSKDADVVILSNIRFPKEVICKCSKLKMICVAFTGYDHVDIDFCRENNIAVYNCSGYSDAAVSELVFAMAINLMRNVIPCQERLRDGGTKDGLVGVELAGKTFGIIGLGAIGMRVAKIASAFDCNVIYYSRSEKDVDFAQYMSLEGILKSADILSVHLPQNNETVDFISHEELAMMKPSAIFINTARGPIVNSRALTTALNSDSIAGAGVDVFGVEPPVTDDPLLSAKNTILTPHIAFASEQSFEKRAVILCKNLIEWENGGIENKIV